jgi:hypothetical protein
MGILHRLLDERFWAEGIFAVAMLLLAIRNFKKSKPFDKDGVTNLGTVRGGSVDRNGRLP